MARRGGDKFHEISHSGPSPTGLGKQLESVISRLLDALVPEQGEPDAIRILLEKHTRDLATARALGADLEKQQAELSIDDPAADEARLGELTRLREVKAKELRQADETVEQIRLAGNFGAMTVEQLEQEIDRLASPTASEDEGGARPMRAEDIATLRDALARRKAALSEQDKITAAIEAEQRKIPAYQRLEEQIAETERDIAAAQDQLDATQKRLEFGSTEEFRGHPAGAGAYPHR